MNTVSLRLAKLRRALRERRQHACIIASADPHLSEYLPEHWQGRRWLSGFTGSAGTLVITARFAGLWTDSRYWAQAQAQLAGTGIRLMKLGDAATPSHIEWLGEHLRAGQCVAVDGAVLGLAAFRALSQQLTPNGIALDITGDPLDGVWAARPNLPKASIYEHQAPYACVTRAAKLAAVRADMAAHGAQAHLLCTLDDIAWLFNLRGADVAYNPVFLAYALVREDVATLFVDEGKIAAPLRAALAADGVTVAAYQSVATALAGLTTDQTLLIDPARVTCGVFRAMKPDVPRVEAINPSTLHKSRKTDAELAQVRETMVQDGVALCEFFAWFESVVGRETITELDIDTQLTAARARRSGYVCPSFATIAGFNANGAMPHYQATPQSHATIGGDGLLLIDSGGQYCGGTTDITRVVPVGTPSADQKTDYTLVLKGMIALSRAVFPRGVPAAALDALARAPIWAGGADYGHGTGHGVGYFLNVHEGPQAIAWRAVSGPHTGMEPGMITSNEPGLYRLGHWGVRIENLVANRLWQTSEFGDFLAFETLTLCPIDTRCIELSLLRADEIAWLNDYHHTVRDQLVPLVAGAARDWLLLRTQALPLPPTVPDKTPAA